MYYVVCLSGARVCLVRRVDCFADDKNTFHITAVRLSDPKPHICIIWRRVW